MDLSKALDGIPHELLMAKMHAYGFNLNSLTFCYSYLESFKQNIKIKNKYRVFQIVLSGVPQGSILGSILLNIFINDLLMSTKTTELYNCVDDGTITSLSDTLSQLAKDLQSEVNKAADWFKINNLILKSDSHLPNKIGVICFIENPLKIIKNAFYFILKALFVLQIFKFLS